MNVHLSPSPQDANRAAADQLAVWLTAPTTRTVMVAAGNTPLELYRILAERRLPLTHLHVFALDEYVGVPLEEPRNCANLMRRHVAEAWGIPSAQFHTVSSLATEAESGIHAHEALIEQRGGLDVVILGLGQNGHLGFNEPGSAENSTGRLLDLDPISTEANRTWFAGKYAPCQGVTVGLRTILAARHALLLAFGAHKRTAVQAMTKGPVGTACPASFLRHHPDAHIFLDAPAGGGASFAEFRT
jgi:glucosamine-6-phosphate deaminase